MARKVGLSRTFNGKRYIREGIRETRKGAIHLADGLRSQGYKARIIRTPSDVHLSGYAYAIYARGQIKQSTISRSRR